MLLLVALLCLGAAQPGVQYCNANKTFVNNKLSDLDITHVILVTRHGDRSPVYFLRIPGDFVQWNCTLNMQASDARAVLTNPKRVLQKQYMPGRNLLPGNCLLGQLTEVGAQQHRELGRNFRLLYVQQLGFLSPGKPHWEEMFLRTTDVERTILSAYNFLEGVWTASNLEAVQINTIDYRADNAFPNTDLCPALQRSYDAVQNSAEFAAVLSQVAPVLQKWGSQWGLKLGLTELNALNDILRARLCHSLPLPPGVAVDDARLLFEVSRQLDNLMDELASGSFLQDLLAALLSDSRRFSLFSAHDDTVRALLFALFVGETQRSDWPAYASHIALERWTNTTDGQQFVVMQYNGANLQMIGCSAVYCPLAQFKALVASYAISPSQCA